MSTTSLQSDRSRGPRMHPEPQCALSPLQGQGPRCGAYLLAVQDSIHTAWQPELVEWHWKVNGHPFVWCPGTHSVWAGVFAVRGDIARARALESNPGLP